MKVNCIVSDFIIKAGLKNPNLKLIKTSYYLKLVNSVHTCPIIPKFICHISAIPKTFSIEIHDFIHCDSGVSKAMTKTLRVRCWHLISSSPILYFRVPGSERRGTRARRNPEPKQGATVPLWSRVDSLFSRIFGSPPLPVPGDVPRVFLEFPRITERGGPRPTRAVVALALVSLSFDMIKTYTATAWYLYVIKRVRYPL